MSDVRLTATNPEDSSVVPVACNERGELLVTDVVIENIPNNVVINGEFEVGDPDTPGQSVTITPSSYSVWRRYVEGSPSGEVRLSAGYTALAVLNAAGEQKYNVSWEGVITPARLALQAEPDNPDHYVTTTRDGGIIKEYKGPTIDVGEELQFLRAQVQTLMERLKMTPEGGWPVWDGSD